MDITLRLQSEFGDAVIIAPAEERHTVDDVKPKCVASPRDEAAAQSLVHWCGRENIAFVPRGNGTKLHIGAPPSRCDLIIATEYLNTVIDHDEGNATVAAGAGLRIQELDLHMRTCRQFVPLAGGPAATLGGTIATNHFSGTKLKEGAPRDLVTGLHAVLSDGRLIKAGGKVVKNVSGYDLNKLFIGSFGTLGLITEVTIRLLPEPESARTWISVGATWDEAVQLAEDIVNGAFEPTILHVLWDEKGVALRAHFEGGETSVASQLARLPRDGDDIEMQEPQGAWLMRAHLPLKNAANFAQHARQMGATSVLWESGLGLVRAAFEETPDVARLRAQAEGAGGFLIVEKAPRKAKTPDFVWGAPRSDFALMKKLKQSYDAANVCAPGRFIGGL